MRSRALNWLLTARRVRAFSSCRRAGRAGEAGKVGLEG